MLYPQNPSNSTINNINDLTNVTSIQWNYPSNLIIIKKNQVFQQNIKNLNYLPSSPFHGDIFDLTEDTFKPKISLSIDKTSIIIMCYQNHNGIFDLITKYADKQYVEIVEEIKIVVHRWNLKQ